MWRAGLLLLGLSALGAVGGPPPHYARAQGLQVELRLSAEPEIFAALRFRMEAGWHLYWKNPGDSGLPPEVAWDLPEGWKAGPLEHPVPIALPSMEGLDYGHSGTFTLLVKLIPPAGKKPKGTVRARLDWLACKEACVRGEALLSANLEDERIRLKPDELDFIRTKFPLKQHTGVQAGPASILKSADQWLIEIPLLGRDAVNAQAFFPEPMPGFSIVHRDVRIKGGVLRIPVLPSGPDSKLTTLRGVLCVGGQGVALELPLPGAPAP